MPAVNSKRTRIGDDALAKPLAGFVRFGALTCRMCRRSVGGMIRQRVARAGGGLGDAESFGATRTLVVATGSGEVSPKGDIELWLTAWSSWDALCPVTRG